MSKWNEKIFGEVATTSKGRLTLQSEAKEQDFLPLINTDAVNGKPNLFGYSKGAVLCESDDVLMLWDGERSGLVAIGFSGVVGSTFAKLTPCDFLDSKYLFYFLDSKFYWIQGQRTGTGVPHVPKNLDKILWVKYPENKPEQKQIAKILSTADAVIEKTQAAIAKYKAIKQGMLQDLFTRGIDLNTNKLRPRYQDAPEFYKEGKLGMIPKEWDEDVLGNIISVSSGEGLTQENIKPGIHLIYGGNGINGSHSDYLFEDSKLIIGRVGEYCGNAYITKPFSWVTDNALVVTPLGKVFLMDFWQYYLNFLDLNSLAFVGAQPVITGGLINKVVVKEIPEDEQILIAERLKGIDNKLQTEQTYLQKMQSLKKGLMEDLLSGKKQVKVSEELVTQNENYYGRIYSRRII